MTEAEYVSLRKKSEKKMIKNLKKVEDNLSEIVTLLTVLERAAKDKDQLDWMKFYAGIDFVISGHVESTGILVDKIRGMVR